MANTIQINVLGDIRDFQRKMGSVSKELTGIQKVSGRAGSFLKKSMKVAGVGIAAAGVAVTAFGKSAVDAASDAQQSVGATETIFGKFADTVISTSDKAATKYGLSANVYRENANLLGSLFANQGVALDQLAGKTEKMVGVGADLAATFGGTTTQAVEALTSAYKGEFDALEKYGISLKQSTVNTEMQRIATQKYGKDLANLSVEQQKALQQEATTNLIMKQSAKTRGQFSKESNTLAGQQQRLAAQFENVKVKLGTALLPIMTELMQVIRKDGIPLLERFAEWFRKEGPDAIESLVSGLRTLLPIVISVAKFIAENGKQILIAVAGFYALTAAVASINAVMTIYRTVAAASVAIQTALTAASLGTRIGLAALAVQTAVTSAVTKAAAAAQWLFNAAMAANPIGLIIIAVIALVAGLVLLWKKSETFRNIVTGAWEAVKKATEVAFKAVWAAIKWAWDAIKTLFLNLTVAGLIIKHWDKIKAATKAAWEWVKNAVKNVLQFIVKLVLNFTVPGLIIKHWDKIKSATGKAWEWVKSKISTVFTAVVAVVKRIGGNIKTVIAAIWTAVKNGVAKAWEGIKTAIGNGVTKAVEVVKGIKNKVVDFFKGAASWLLSAGKDIVMGLINGLGDKLGALKDMAGKIGSTVKNGVKGLLGINSPSKVMMEFGRNIGEGLEIGMQRTMTGVRKTAGGMAGQVEKGFSAPRLELNAEAGRAAMTTGNTYNINVAVPVGANKAQIGREIVDSIKHYESVAGRNWRN